MSHAPLNSQYIMSFWLFLPVRMPRPVHWLSHISFSSVPPFLKLHRTAVLQVWPVGHFLDILAIATSDILCVTLYPCGKKSKLSIC